MADFDCGRCNEIAIPPVFLHDDHLVCGSCLRHLPQRASSSGRIMSCFCGLDLLLDHIDHSVASALTPVSSSSSSSASASSVFSTASTASSATSSSARSQQQQLNASSFAFPSHAATPSSDASARSLFPQAPVKAPSAATTPSSSHFVAPSASASASSSSSSAPLSAAAASVHCNFCEHERAGLGAGLEDGETPVARCLDCCVSVCSAHARAHLQEAASSAHLLVSLQELRHNPELGSGYRSPYLPLVRCSVHPRGDNRLRSFCASCSSFVCAQCLTGEHRGHRDVSPAIRAHLEHQQAASALLLRVREPREMMAALQSALQAKSRAVQRLVLDQERQLQERVARASAALMAAVEERVQRIASVSRAASSLVADAESLQRAVAENEFVAIPTLTAQIEANFGAAEQQMRVLQAHRHDLIDSIFYEENQQHTLMSERAMTDKIAADLFALAFPDSAAASAVAARDAAAESGELPPGSSSSAPEGSARALLPSVVSSSAPYSAPSSAQTSVSASAAALASSSSSPSSSSVPSALAGRASFSAAALSAPGAALVSQPAAPDSPSDSVESKTGSGTPVLAASYSATVSKMRALSLELDASSSDAVALAKAGKAAAAVAVVPKPLAKAPVAAIKGVVNGVGPNVPVGSCVFVSGLAFDKEKRDLIAHFSRCGTVTRVVLPLFDHANYKGKKRGIAFIYFSTGVSTKALRSARMYDDREIQISTFPQRTQFRCLRVCVKNLAFEATEEDVKNAIEFAGPITSIEMRNDTITQRPVAFVTFEKSESADLVIERQMDNILIPVWPAVFTYDFHNMKKRV